ncbi:MAG TPA: addiction module protein [Xanthobacteraceae bacterium]
MREEIVEKIIEMNKLLLSELLQLSPAERIQLAEDLWDSVCAWPENLPEITDSQRAEIERRLAEHKSEPDAAISWDEVRARLWSRLG